MPKITFISHENEMVEVSTSSGTSVMQAAIDNGVAGIDGDCGGNCVCATCHVFVGQAWRAKIADPDLNEEGMLDFVDGRNQNSRLACQIEMRDALDGIEVRMPEAQQ